MDIDRPSLAAAALYDLKNEQLQLANAALQQQAASERIQQDASVESKQPDAAVANQPVTTTAGGQQFTEEGSNPPSSARPHRSLPLVTEVGAEIPFDIGQFLLYKGHFLNLLHFPIWKVHTKTLLLKYDTVLADSEIAWEATDEVQIHAHATNSTSHFDLTLGNVLHKCLRRLRTSQM